MTDSEDPVVRARLLEEREKQAGGPSALVASLVAGQARLSRALKLEIIGLLADFVLTMGFFGIWLITHHNEQRTLDNSKALARTIAVSRYNIEAQAVYNWGQCDARRINALQLNDKNAALLAFLRSISPQTPPLIKFAELSDAKLIVPVCGPKPPDPTPIDGPKR